MRSPRRIDFTHKVLKKNTYNSSKPPTDSFSWKLWLDSIDLAEKALQSKYMQGIADGNLNPISFGQYTIQDCAYCDSAKKDYATMESTARRENKYDIADFASARYDSYTKYVKEILQKWHIADTNAILLGEAVSNYIEFEHMIANTSFPIMGIISMIPCDQLWAWLATQLKDKVNPNNIYNFWITNNDDWTGSYRLDNFVNEEIKKNSPDVHQNILNAIYRSCMTCEVNFFRSACGEPLISMPDLNSLKELSL